MNLKRLFVIIALAAWAFSAAALPSVEAVQAEVQKGHYVQAEAMMQDVVAAKPGSAKAHYIYAEILAHNKRFDEARRQVSAAREIDPALSFTDPAKFKSLEQLLAREAQAEKPAATLGTPAAPAVRYSPPAAVEPQRSQGIPGWVWAFGLAGLAAVLWMMTRRRAAAPAGTMMAPAMGGGMAQPGYGPGYPQPASNGPGMLGVGLAAAGGVAAGMLAERLLEGGHRDSGGSAAVGSGGGSGLVPGMFDDVPGNGAARELEDRPIDFGNGDGWGGGDVGGGDDGGSGGGDGW